MKKLTHYFFLFFIFLNLNTICHSKEIYDVEILPSLRSQQYPLNLNKKIIIFSAPRTGSSLTYNIFRFLFEDDSMIFSRHDDFNLDRFVLKTHRFEELKLINEENVTYIFTLRNPIHTCLSHYAVLASLGKFPKKLLNTYTDINSILQGHESIDVPGVEFSSGALGQGLSFAAGLALGDKDHHTVCLTSDGEHDEGQIWEAVMFANKYHLGNLINIVDCNKFQIDGSTTDIMPTDELAAKYLRFGWTVTSVNGHDFNALHKAIIKAKNSSIYPACIIAHTTLAKGISFMEKDYHYHDIKDMSEDVYSQAKHELEVKNED